jgi:hypothetical protein
MSALPTRRPTCAGRPRIAAQLAEHSLRTVRAVDALVFGREPHVAFEPSTIRRHALDAWDGYNAAALTAAGNSLVRSSTPRAEMERAPGSSADENWLGNVMLAMGVQVQAVDAGTYTITVMFDDVEYTLPVHVVLATEGLSARQSRAS